MSTQSFQPPLTDGSIGITSQLCYIWIFFKPSSGSMPILAIVSIQFRGKNLLRTIVFLLLFLLSIGLGAFAGLLIVYKSDLPEVKQLEDYRPNVITELY